MRTALVTTTYLIPQERYDKTLKFFNYYRDVVNWDIYILDNASPVDLCAKLFIEAITSNIINFKEHYDRPSHLDYKYLWRAVHYLQELLKIYDKIVYMDNDFYILNPEMIRYIEDLKDGWTTFYCKQYGFNETGCHIITKDCKEYLDFVNMSQEDFINKYNNVENMELLLPVTRVEKKFNGDRYGEKVLEQTPEMDYYAQADVKTILRYNK